MILINFCFTSFNFMPFTLKISSKLYIILGYVLSTQAFGRSDGFQSNKVHFEALTLSYSTLDTHWNKNMKNFTKLPKIVNILGAACKTKEDCRLYRGFNTLIWEFQDFCQCSIFPLLQYRTILSLAKPLISYRNLSLFSLLYDLVNITLRC